MNQPTAFKKMLFTVFFSFFCNTEILSK